MAVNTNNPPVPYPNPVRYPLATPLSNRGVDIGVDGLMVNCYVEKDNDTGKVYVQKRPGMDNSFTFASGAGTPQGLFYFKGYFFGVATNVMYSLQAPVAQNNASGTAWTQATVPTWAARFNGSAVVFKNQIVTIGGFDGGVNVYNDVWGSSDGENWTQLCSAAPWGNRQGAVAVVFNDRLYVIGGVGLGGVLKNDVWVSDDGQTWNQLTAAAGFTPRVGHRAIAFNSGIFVLGGGDATGYLQDVWFTTDGTNWTQTIAAATWAVRADFGAAVVGDQLFVYGGYAGGAIYRNDCYSTRDGITWTLRNAAPFATARGEFGYCVYEGKMWAFGGEGPGPVLNTDVYSSVDGITWVLVGAAPGWTARRWSSAVAFRSPTAISSINTPTLWLLGGRNAGFAALREVWRGNINGANNATWAVPNPVASIERLDSCTANANEFLVLKDTAGMYLFTGNTLLRVQDPNYPKTTVPGVVNLDETVYVMDPSGLIFGSAIGDPRTWPAFNYIGADYESDKGVAIIKNKDFLIAFGEFTTQAFFNSGSAFGSLLRPAKNANFTIGCSFPASIVNCDDTIVWVGRGAKATGRKVYAMTGLIAKPISNPMIERLIQQQNFTDIKSSYMKVSGHRFYIMQINAPVFQTFAYDIDTGLWFRMFFKRLQWALSFQATDGVKDYYLRDTLPEVYIVNPTNQGDGGTVIDLAITTNLIDMDTMRQKFNHGVSLVCDRGCGIVYLQYNDKDYDLSSWSALRAIDTDSTAERFRIARLGDFTRRAFKLTHTYADKPFRAEALELEIDMGFR